MNIKFYEVERNYVEYLISCEPQLFHNRKKGQTHERKYIGIILQVNELEYFAPLSSYKPKHKSMREGLDFIKIQTYAVINLNNMFPVPPAVRSYIDFNTIEDRKYRFLLLSEYRFIKSIQDRIRKNAAALYKHKLINGNATPLAKRCNDFHLLESMCKKYEHQQNKS